MYIYFNFKTSVIINVFLLFPLIFMYLFLSEQSLKHCYLQNTVNISKNPIPHRQYLLVAFLKGYHAHFCPLFSDFYNFITDVVVLDCKYNFCNFSNIMLCGSIVAEMYRSGYNGPDSKSGSSFLGLVGSNPTISATVILYLFYNAKIL